MIFIIVFIVKGIYEEIQINKCCINVMNLKRVCWEERGCKERERESSCAGAEPRHLPGPDVKVKVCQRDAELQRRRTDGSEQIIWSKHTGEFTELHS